jgi:hypothetical protein
LSGTTSLPVTGSIATRDNLIKFYVAVDATRIRVRATIRDGKTKLMDELTP